MSIEQEINQAHANEDIAIVGMACLFPGAGDIKTYWQNILNKVDAVTDPPPDWGGEAWFDPASSANDRIYAKRGGYLGDLARFDPLRYGVMPSAVDGAEPEHFLALKVANEALADAGVPEIPLDRERTELIIGRGTFINRGYTTLHQHGLFLDQTLSLIRELTPDYPPEKLQQLREKLKATLPPFTPETAPGLVSSVMTGRIANRLDIRGANFAVDAACASSLIAVELGLQRLLTGKCDLVLAGGVQLSTHHLMLMVFTQLGALSRSSHIRPLDKDADGTLLGEGVGFVVLKRRRDAERDGNRIYAILKAVGSSSDGRGKSVVAPTVEGEEMAIRKAYEMADISPSTVGLLETHGTAMPMGDLTEIQAMRAVFGNRNSGPPQCAIGSVKSMIAHLIPASGMAGLIKAALALWHKVLPPTLHFAQPHPKLEMEKSCFYVNTESRPWIHGGSQGPRRAGVNSFGFGGINAHAILEEYTGEDEAAAENLCRSWDTELCFFRGDSRQALIHLGEQVLGYLQSSPAIDLVDLASTLNSKATGNSRLAIVASSVEDLRRKLEHALERLKNPQSLRIKDKSGIYYFAEPLACQGRLAFLFPGEGSQYPNMLGDLCLHFPEVRSCFDYLDRAYAHHPKGKLPSHAIFPPPNGGPGETQVEEKLWQVDYAVDAVTTADRALFRLFNCLEIRPDVVLGHSSGEFMALEAAGALEVGHQDLHQHIIAGNSMNEDLTAGGVVPETLLFAVGAADPKVVADLVQESEGNLAIAMYNCPNQVVLCGDHETANRAMVQFRDQGAICQALPFNRPYHTRWYTPAGVPMREFFRQLKIVSPQVEIYSCMTAAPIPPDPDEVRRLAVEQWVHPVQFQETIEAMYQAGVRLFVEVGPRANLTSFVSDTLKKKTHLAVATNVHHRSGVTQLNHALGLLAAHGVPMRLDYLYQRRRPRDLAAEIAAGSHPAEKTAPKLSLALPTIGLEGLEELRVKPSPDVLPEITGRPCSASPPAGKEPTPSIMPGGSRPSSAGRPTPDRLRPQAPPAADCRSRAMQEYFLTMGRFLLTQQEVMEAYFSQGRLLEVHIGADGSQALGESARPSDMLPGAEPQRERRHDEGMAAGGLGAAVVSDATQPVGSALPGQESKSPERAPWSRESLGKLLLSLVSAKTGYPEDMLTLDQDLEADLGIDSIKRVEILGTFKERAGNFSAELMNQLTGRHTLGQMIDLLMSLPHGPQEKAEAPRLSPQAQKLTAGPFIGTIVSHSPGQELVALRDFDLEEDIFLLDHTFGRKISVTDPELTGLPLMPLTVSLEIMAEAATLLNPDKLLVGMRAVRAYRWITFAEKRLTLRLEARRRSRAEVQVQVRSADDPGSGTSAGLPILEGIMVFDDRYPPAPAAAEFSLQGRRLSTLAPERLYAEGMFMGPTFQGVASVDWWGEDGIEAAMRILPFRGFFKSREPSGFVTDPVLLDAAGQLVAYWVADHQEVYNVYPFRIEELRIYGPNLRPGDKIIGRARVRRVEQHQLSSDIDIIGPAGEVHLRITGWDDRSFELPANFYRLRFRPGDEMLSTPWLAPISAYSGNGTLTCCRMEDLPHDLLHAHGKVWQLALAHLALSRREREIWQKLPPSEKRRTEWLLARVAGKDAIRGLLKTLYGLELCLPDVEIESDAYGRPLIKGWAGEIGRQPSLSLAHTRGLAVAMACGEGAGCGIDVERVDTRREGIDKFSFTSDERDLVHSHLGQLDLEWVLRIWCAKEAVGKALGRGLPGGPGDLKVRQINPDTGTVSLEIMAKLAAQLGEPTGKILDAHTLCEGDLIGASALYIKGG